MDDADLQVHAHERTTGTDANNSVQQQRATTACTQRTPQLMRTRLDPVVVHKQDRLCAALLTAARIGILVGHPRHILQFLHIWAQNLPVKPSVFKVHLPAVGDGGCGGVVVWWCDECEVGCGDFGIRCVG